VPYRRTENVVRRLAEREQTIVDAARAAAAWGGMAAVQIAEVAERAGIASGTVYRYFPSKSDLVTELVGAVTERALDAMRAAADAAPGPLSALAAAIAAFSARVLAERRLAWAAIAEPSDSEIDEVRREFRKSLVAELQSRLRLAMTHGHLPDQDVAIAAPAVVGALLEGLIGPHAPDIGADNAKAREAVQNATLFALRGLGVVDARARGLVAQIKLPDTRSI
jgi:AcrR family transcriptional regulator